jgi:hypothetical protein
MLFEISGVMQLPSIQRHSPEAINLLLSPTLRGCFRAVDLRPVRARADGAPPPRSQGISDSVSRRIRLQLLRLQGWDVPGNAELVAPPLGAWLLHIVILTAIVCVAITGPSKDLPLTRVRA